MRQLIRFLAFVVAFVAFPTALILAGFCTHLDAVAGRAQPEPQPLRLADLTANGPGENLHVTLTDFAFGPPVIEEADGTWKGVWLPLLLPGRRNRDAVPAAFFYARRITGKEQLDEIRTTKSLTGLVASALPDSPQTLTPAVILYEPYPRLDPNQTLVLTDAALIFGGQTILPSEKWFHPNTPRIGWGAAGAALLIGLLSAFIAYRAGRESSQGGSRPVPNFADASRLPETHPISVHQHVSAGINGAVLAVIAGAFICGLGAILLIPSAINSFRTGEVAPAIVMLLIAVGLAAATYALTLFFINQYAYPITKIAVYATGIRWQQRGRTFSARWADIVAVWKNDVVMYMNGEYKGEIHTITLDFVGGKRFTLNADTLQDYEDFSRRVQSAHAGYIIDARGRDLAERGRAEFGSIVVRRDGLTVGGTDVPWSDLERFDIENGTLNLYSSKAFWFSKCKSIPLHSIPDYAALLEFLRPKVLSY